MKKLTTRQKRDLAITESLGCVKSALIAGMDGEFTGLGKGFVIRVSTQSGRVLNMHAEPWFGLRQGSSDTAANMAYWRKYRRNLYA